jgi:hypothetical protein
MAGPFHSIGGDHEDGHFAQLPENVRDLVVFSVIAPDYPDSAAGWSSGEHLEGAILPLLEVEDTLERGFDLLRREAMRVDFLQVPLDPLELPHAPAPWEAGVRIPSRETTSKRIRTTMGKPHT